MVHRKLANQAEMFYAFQYWYVNILVVYMLTNVLCVCVCVYISKVEQLKDK